MQHILQRILRQPEGQQPCQFLLRLPHREVAPEEKLHLAEFLQKCLDKIAVHKLQCAGKVEIEPFRWLQQITGLLHVRIPAHVCCDHGQLRKLLQHTL